GGSIRSVSDLISLSSELQTVTMCNGRPIGRINSSILRIHDGSKDIAVQTHFALTAVVEKRPTPAVVSKVERADLGVSRLPTRGGFELHTDRMFVNSYGGETADPVRRDLLRQLNRLEVDHSA